MRTIISIVFLLFILHCRAQSTDTPKNNFSMGIGTGYGLIQDRYDDGNLTYKISEYRWRPFVINLRYTNTRSSGNGIMVNLQYNPLIRTVGDIIENLPMLFLNAGYGQALGKEKKWSISGSVGPALIENSIGYSIHPGVKCQVLKKLSIETQFVYARTFPLSFTGYQLADLRLLVHYQF